MEDFPVGGEKLLEDHSPSLSRWRIQELVGTPPLYDFQELLLQLPHV